MAREPGGKAAATLATSRVSDIITTFRPSKTFPIPEAKPGDVKITSLDFDDSGDHCVVACTDETLQLYDCKQGKHMKTLMSKKYGVHLARFSHNSQNVIYASTKEDDTMRYLSLHDNHYIRYFKGHKRKVTSLEVSPVDDQVLSASLDDTVRLWDLRTPTCHGQLNLACPALASFDPTGIIFAVASSASSHLLMYDVRNYDKTPFAEAAISDDTYLQQFGYPPQMPEWNKLEFSNDGNRILLGTKGHAHYVLDSFTLEIKERLRRSSARDGSLNSAVASSGDVCFTPDGQYVIGGQAEKNLLLWGGWADGSKGEGKQEMGPMHQFETKQSANVVGYNPRYNLLVSGYENLTLWLPEQRSTTPPLA